MSDLSPIPSLLSRNCHSEQREESPYLSRAAKEADSFATMRNDKQRTGNDNDEMRRFFAPLRMTSSERNAAISGSLEADSFAALRNDKQKSDQPIVDDEGDGTPFDKLREECGVMAVYGHPDAARMTYWGLYALQHRGQESAGIASADGHEVIDFKGMGLVSEIFTDEVLAKMPGHIAIGDTRYSTTGDSALLNAQPISL